MKFRLLLLLASGMLFLVTASIALSSAPVENKGAAEIKLPGGTRGLVPFPHHRHQDKLGDCEICHSLFPQKAGIIKELKEQGKLKKKHVMNTLCTKCHKQKKKEGLKSGPTTCSKCHIKEKK
ncbi:MAG: cytochrome c3 family protein [Desulfobacterales bacterium]